jgi:hypothetical protein
MNRPIARPTKHHSRKRRKWLSQSRKNLRHYRGSGDEYLHMQMPKLLRNEQRSPHDIVLDVFGQIGDKSGW